VISVRTWTYVSLKWRPKFLKSEKCRITFSFDHEDPTSFSEFRIKFNVVVLLHTRPTGMVSLLKREEKKRIPKWKKLLVFILSLDSPICQLRPTFYGIKNRSHMPKILPIFSHPPHFRNLHFSSSFLKLYPLNHHTWSFSYPALLSSAILQYLVIFKTCGMQKITHTYQISAFYNSPTLSHFHDLPCFSPTLSHFHDLPRFTILMLSRR
jgi:hypothetical protein